MFCLCMVANPPCYYWEYLLRQFTSLCWVKSLGRMRLSWNRRCNGFIKKQMVIQMLHIHLCQKVKAVQYQGNSPITPFFVLTIVFLRNSLRAFAFRFSFMLSFASPLYFQFDDSLFASLFYPLVHCHFSNCGSDIVVVFFSSLNWLWFIYA